VVFWRDELRSELRAQPAERLQVRVEEQRRARRVEREQPVLYLTPCGFSRGYDFFEK